MTEPTPITYANVLNRDTLWVKDLRPLEVRQARALLSCWVQEIDLESGHLWVRSKHTHRDMFFWIKPMVQREDQITEIREDQCPTTILLSHYPSHQEIEADRKEIAEYFHKDRPKTAPRPSLSFAEEIEYGYRSYWD